MNGRPNDRKICLAGLCASLLIALLFFFLETAVDPAFHRASGVVYVLCAFTGIICAVRLVRSPTRENSAGEKPAEPKTTADAPAQKAPHEEPSPAPAAVTRREAESAAQPSGIPDGLEFTPDQMYMRVKSERCTELGDRLIGSPLALSPLSEEELRKEHLSCTELIWAYEAMEMVIGMGASSPESLERKELFRRSAVQRLLEEPCFVLFSTATHLPLLTSDFMWIYDNELKAKSAAERVDQLREPGTCYVRRFEPEQMEEAARYWQAEGYSKYVISGKDPEFLLSEIAALPPDLFPCNQELCKMLINFATATWTVQEEIFYLPRLRGEILTKARECSFLTLYHPDEPSAQDGTVQQRSIRPYGDGIGLWTDRYALEEYLRDKDPALRRDIGVCSFEEAEGLCRDHPDRYRSVVLDPEQISYTFRAGQ